MEDPKSEWGPLGAPEDSVAFRNVPKGNKNLREPQKFPNVSRDPAEGGL